MPRYVLEQRIGNGGMAEVFRARLEGDEGFRRPCAVKRLLPELRRDPMLQKRFIDEARISGRLRHPCIVGVIDFYEADGIHHLVLDLVEGLSVEELVIRSRDGAFVPPAVTRAIVIETARALQHAHAGQVLHRDVSCCNILVSNAGDVRLADFGLADAVGRLSATEPGSVAGKLAYMSPARRRGAPATPEDDVHALGIVLERLLEAADPRARASAEGRELKALQRRLVSGAAGDWPVLLDAMRRGTAATPEAIAAHVARVTTGRRTSPPAHTPDSFDGPTLAPRR